VGVSFLLDKILFSAESPLSPPFHPHSLMSELFRSVQVGCSRLLQPDKAAWNLALHSSDGSGN
jgi:hypothetical protein